MHILVTYDVDTTSKEGARRLRHVAKACIDYGLLIERIKRIIDMSLDSVRFYILNKNENKRVKVIGVETAYKVNNALII